MSSTGSSARTEAMATRVLMVCLGNICRSPMAEGILRHQIEKHGLAVEVDSAGTANYHVGDAPDVRAQQTLRQRGIEIGTLRGRQLKASDLDAFDHVLVMDSSNLSNTLKLCQTAAHRAKVRTMMADGTDVPDPYYGSISDFEAVADQIEKACGQFLIRLTKGE